MSNRIIAPIDEKNVSTDWVDDVFDDCECAKSQKKSLCKMCGFVCGELVECTYHLGDYVMYWYIHSHYNEIDDVRTELQKRLAKYEGEENDLFSEIVNYKTHLIQKFYFKGE